MNGITVLTIVGTIVRDPELKYTPSGLAICELTLVVNTKRREQKTSLFMPTTFWGKTAETVSEYCRKGSGLLATGELEQDEWIDKDTGKKRTKFKLNAKSFSFVGGRGEASPDRDSIGDLEPSNKPSPYIPQDPIVDSEYEMPF
jgi:single-strand DNA-binding protein